MNLFSLIGDFSTFFFRSLFIPWKIRTSRSRILEQVFNIGIGSLPIIMIIAAFTGLVSTVQTTYQLIGTVPRYIVGTTVVRMVLIELGPILTALMISGRCASSMAAEIGSMRVTEQIDALEIMAIDPYRFLSLPRIVGTFIALPVLTIISEFIALGFGALLLLTGISLSYSLFLMRQMSLLTAEVSVDFDAAALSRGLLEDLSLMRTVSRVHQTLADPDLTIYRASAAWFS